jgi:transcriptional regulator with XRE-family HTH domain
VSDRGRDGAAGVRSASQKASERRHYLSALGTVVTMSELQAVTTNTALRAVRESLRLSQEEFARAIRDAGERLGEPNDCTKRLVQRWESGLVSTPRGNYARALEYVTGIPVENLGFEGADERYGVSRRQAMGVAAAAAVIPISEAKAKGPLTGIWLSRYEYPSSSRGKVYSGAHHVVVIQRGSKVQVRSIGSPSKLLMDLTAEGNVLTGTWREETDPDGYYRGATYHGAIQLTVGPSGHRMKGQWAGFGKDGEVNSGPWTLDLVSSDTGADAIHKFSRPPE